MPEFAFKGFKTGQCVPPKQRKENKMNPTRIKAAVIAALLAVTTEALAAVVTLQTPPTGEFPDTESSAVVPIHDWPDYGRRVNLTLSAHATPSNNVQVAFGKDLNGDEDLEPEETELVVGFDCGVWFARDERPVTRPSLVTDFWAEDDSSPTNTTQTIRLKQVMAVADRFNLAKVTVRGRGESAAEIAAEVYRRGNAVILR